MVILKKPICFIYLFWIVNPKIQHTQKIDLIFKKLAKNAQKFLKNKFFN